MIYDINRTIESHLNANHPDSHELSGDENRDVYNHAFWINDLLFIVPPSHISIDTDYTIFQWKSLRTSTTVKTHSGQSSTYIKVDFVIPAGNSIINVNQAKPGRTGRRGGLTDLILEFKYTPFCFIENAFIRSNLGLQSDFNMGATLHQLNTSTVPGYPGLINAELILGLFNYRPYTTNLVYKDKWNSKEGNQFTFEDANPSIFNQDITDLNSNTSRSGELPNNGGFSLSETVTLNQPLNDYFQTSSLRNDEPGIEEAALGTEELRTDLPDRPSDTFIANADTWQNEDLQYHDLRLIYPPEAVRTPAQSEVYTEYIDWLRTQWQEEGYSSDFQPIDSKQHNLGDEIIFRWKEYTRFEMPNDVWESLRHDIRDELEDRTIVFDDNVSESSTIVPQFTGFDTLADIVNEPIRQPLASESLGDYLLEHRCGSWAGKIVEHIEEHERSIMPPRELWSNIVPTARLANQLVSITGIRANIGGHSSLYRSGNGTSQHNEFGALDIIPILANDTDLRVFQYILILIYESVGERLGEGLGLGFYVTDNFRKRALIHIDTSRSRRAWVHQGEHDLRSAEITNREWNNIRNEVDITEITRLIGINNLEDGIDNLPVDDGLPSTPGRNEEASTVESPATEEMFTRITNSNSAYRDWVNSIRADGFEHYDSDISVLDVFYKQKRMVINASNEDGNDLVSSYLNPTATSINVELVNLFKQLPLNGHPIPTAQFLGGMDTNYTVNIISHTLDQLKDLKEMKQRLELQAKNYRHIPDSWVLQVQNPLMNVYGHKWAVIASDATDTIPGSPGTYQTELHLVGHRPWSDTAGFSYIGARDPQRVFRAFFQDLIEQEFIYPISSAREGFQSSAGSAFSTGVFVDENGIDLANSTDSISIDNPLLNIGPGQQRTYVGNETLLLDAYRSTVGVNLGRLTGNDAANVHFDGVRSGLVKLKLVIEQINQTLLTSNRGIGIDVESLDFLGLGAASLGDNTLIRRAGSYYYDNILLRMIYENNGVFESDAIVPRLDSILDNEDLEDRFFLLDNPRDRSKLRLLLNSFEMPWPIDWDYRNGMSMDILRSGSALIAPNPYRDFDTNIQWQQQPWLWNIGYVGHYAASTLNLLRTARGAGPPQYRTILDNYDFTRLAGETMQGILDVYSDIPHVEEIYNTFFLNARLFENHLPRTLGRVNLIDSSRLEIPNFIVERDLEDIRATVGQDTDNEDDLIFTGRGVTQNTTRHDRIGSLLAPPLENAQEYIDIALDYWVPTSDVMEGRLENEASLVTNLETYLYNSVFLPSIAACFSYTDMVNEWSSFRDEAGNPLFPNLAREVQQQLINSGGSCYPDLKLPNHPFWVEIHDTESDSKVNSSVFTNPDFYFYNWGFEGALEDVEDIHGMTGLIVEETASAAMSDWTPTPEDELPTAPTIGGFVNANTTGRGSIGSVAPTTETVMEMVWYPADVWGGRLPSFSNSSLEEFRRRVESADRVSIREPVDVVAGLSYVPDLISGANSVAFDDASVMRITGITQRLNPFNVEQSIAEFISTARHTLDKSSVTPNTLTLSDASNEIEAAVVINRIIRDAIDNESTLNWRNVQFGYGRNAAATLTPSPRFRTRLRPVDLINLEDYARDDVTPGWGTRLLSGGVSGGVANLWDAIVNPETAVERHERQLRNDRQAAVFNTLTGFSIPMPGANSMGSWEDSRTYEADEVLDYSFSREALYYLAYEGMKDLDRKKFCMRRAFPTFKVYFIEYDSLEQQWNALDDFYSYQQIQSIRIVRSRKVPADLCIIEFLNVGGSLDGNDAKTRLARMFNAQQFDSNEPQSRIRPVGETNDPRLQDTEAEQSISGFVLEEGNTVKVKLGYNNDPEKLEDVFLGQVVRVEHSANSDKISVVCQSYATELVAKIKGRTSDEVGSTGYVNTFDLLAHMMFEPEVVHFGRNTLNRVSWLGEDQSISTNDYIVNSQSGIPWGNILGWVARLGGVVVTGGASLLIEAGVRGVIGLGKLVGKAFTNTSISPEEGPQDDNIFVPDERHLGDHAWLFDDGQIDSAEYEYHPVSTTIWDIFQEMTLRHPGWIASAVPYGNSARMTMFFGLPTQRYWARSAQGFDNFTLDRLVADSFSPYGHGRVRDPKSLRKYFNAVAKRFRPFRNYHIITSQTDIIDNSIVATKHGVFNTVSVHYWEDNPDEPGEAENLTQDDLEDNVVTIKAVSDLEDSDVREAYVTYRNCFDKETELYTKRGWINFEEVREDDIVLSLDPESLDLEWLPIEEKIEQYAKEMIHFKARNFDLMVTPDHQIPCSTRTSGRNKMTPLQFLDADKLESKHFFYRSSNWQGSIPNKLDTFGLSLKDFCIFMGYYLSKGHTKIHKNTDDLSVQVFIAQHKSDSKEIMSNNLMNMAFDYISETANGFYIRHKGLEKYLLQFGKSYEKYIPNFIKELPVYYINIFLEAFIQGDGHKEYRINSIGEKYLSQTSISSSSKKLIEDLGELILKVGLHPSFHETNAHMVEHHNGIFKSRKQYHVRLCRANYFGIGRMKQEPYMVNYDDISYCVKLPKFHTLYVRRNNQVCWAGNCKGKLLARRYATSSLAKHVKDMYKGSVIILGNPRMKPYDLVYLADSFTDMCGPIEIEEVVHTFSHETGFITEIVPDAFVIASDPGTFWTYFAQKYFVSQKIHKYMGNGASIIPDIYNDRYDNTNKVPDGGSPISNTPLDTEDNIVLTRRTRESIGFDRDDPNETLGTTDDVNHRNRFVGAGAVGALSRSVPGVGAAILSIGMWMLGDYLYYSWTRKRQAFFICPLIKNGSPLTAGLPWTVNSSYISLVGSKIRRWFTHSRDGLIEWNYAAMQYRDAVWERFNGDIPALTRTVMNFRTGWGGSVTGTTPW